MKMPRARTSDVEIARGEPAGITDPRPCRQKIFLGSLGLLITTSVVGFAIGLGNATPANWLVKPPVVAPNGVIGAVAALASRHRRPRL